MSVRCNITKKVYRYVISNRSQDGLKRQQNKRKTIAQESIENNNPCSVGVRNCKEAYTNNVHGNNRNHIS